MRISQTNVDYIGNQMSMDNKTKIDNFNKQFDLKEKEVKEIVKDIVEVQKVKEPTPISEAEKTVKLNQVMTHNVVQNMSTQEIMKMILKP